MDSMNNKYVNMLAQADFSTETGFKGRIAQKAL